VSPQTLYILQNLAAADVEQPWRYAIELQDDGYLAVRPDDDDYALFTQVANQVALQLMPELAMAGTLLNYVTSVVVRTVIDNAASGTNYLTIQGPGSDKAWVLDSVGARNINHNPSIISLYLYLNPTYYPLKSVAGPGVGAWVLHQQPVHLSHDLAIVAEIDGCTAGDVLVLAVSGYEMELVE
jgi:hypothetical protein